MRPISEKAKKYYKELVQNALHFMDSYKEMDAYQHDKEFNHVAINIKYVSVNMFNDLKRCNENAVLECNNAIKCATYTKNEELKEAYSKRLIANRIVKNSFKIYLEEVKEYSLKWDNVKA